MHVCMHVYACVPCRSGLEVSEVCVEHPDGVIAHHVDEVYVGEPGPQQTNHLPPVLGQHGVQLPLVPAQRRVPGQDVVPVRVVKHCGDRQGTGTGCSPGTSGPTLRTNSDSDSSRVGRGWGCGGVMEGESRSLWVFSSL